MPSTTSQSRTLARKAPDHPEPPPALRLVAFQGGIGIELAAPVSRRPFFVEDLSWSLPGLKPPVDLSGGVRAFRHRRGLLQRAAAAIELLELQRWIEGRARSWIAARPLRVEVWRLREGLGIGLATHSGALAFDLLWAPEGDVARFVVAAPRSAGDFKGPSVTHAVRLCDAVLGALAERSGRVVSFGSLGRGLSELLLPAAGVRMPAIEALELGSLDFRAERIHVEAERARGPLKFPERTVRALEFAALVAEADGYLEAGETEPARQCYLAALERAPRHPELCHAVAAIDKDFAERSEAALGLLIESLPAVEFGSVGAELLARGGDMGGARLAIEKQASHETFAPLAALWWVQLAELAGNSPERSEYLERALAISPASHAARWARFSLRVALGDVNGAISDAEHLEAATTGNRERQLVNLEAARALQAVGYGVPAGRLFERALRYAPKDPDACLGMAESLLSVAKPERAFALLQRAAELASDASVKGRSNVLLGRLLAEHYRDIPQAIARVRAVEGVTEIAVEARALEAKWRGQLGDLAGATLAYARMRDLIEHLTLPESTKVSEWLLEAAQLAVERREPRVAERHLGLALRICPRDGRVAAAYRRVALELSGASAEPAGALDTAAALQPAQSGAGEPAHSAPAEVKQPEFHEDTDEEVERRVEQLKGQLQAGGALAPELLAELRDGLARLSRHAELFALLQARYEDANPEERAVLRPELRHVLAELSRVTRDTSPEEADIYEQMQQHYA